MTSFTATACLILSILTQPPQTPTRIRLTDLYNQPVQAGSLKITFLEFKREGLFSAGWIKIEVENTLPDPVNFVPAHLYFVGKDGSQSNVLGIPFGGNRSYTALNQGEQIICATDLIIGPKAKVKEGYLLSDKVHLPARVYYHDKVVLEIID